METREIEDPAEYLLRQAEFHDCRLTVGDPESGEVEELGVVRSQLVAHSPVFRALLMDSGMADPSGSNTHIKDVHPEIFKLMLKHMYGGKLSELKTIDKESVLELAFCADKYNVQPLVEKACKRMIPNSVDEVFVPLRFVAYVPNLVLAPQVANIVQEETDKIFKHEKFLSLDEKCLQFIFKQGKLSIDAFDLWISLVKWLKNKAQQSNFTLQQLQLKPLNHIIVSSGRAVKLHIYLGDLSTFEESLLPPEQGNFNDPQTCKVHGLSGRLKKRKSTRNISSWNSQTRTMFYWSVRHSATENCKNHKTHEIVSLQYC